MRLIVRERTVKIWLSDWDTWQWATEPGREWPCSELNDHRVFAEFYKGDLVDIRIDGKYLDERRPGPDVDELNACVADHLTTRPKQFPPTHPDYWALVERFRP